MKYKCVIIDDEELARELLVEHIDHFEELELVQICASAIEARQIKFEEIDLLFLDIEMPVLKGTNFFKHLELKPAVIFTTAHREYALDGFELDAIDYLLKPITFHRFFKAVNKYLKSQHAPQVQPESSKDFMFIRKDRKQVKLHFDTVLYIESLKDYIRIHSSARTHTIKYSLSGFEALLDNRFLRIHRSYIINKEKVTAYTKNDVEIEEREIPIGSHYRQMVEAALNRC